MREMRADVRREARRRADCSGSAAVCRACVPRAAYKKMAKRTGGKPDVPSAVVNVANIKSENRK